MCLCTSLSMQPGPPTRPVCVCTHYNSQTWGAPTSDLPPFCLQWGLDNLRGEVVTHSRLQHPHIVRVREVFLQGMYVNVVMEHVSGGDLFTYVQARNRLREPLAR